MSTPKSELSSNFADAVNKLHQRPENSRLKKEVLTLYVQLKSLAKKNPDDSVLNCRLARSLSPTMSEHRQYLQKAAEQGNTHAMLELCDLYLKSGKDHDVAKAAHYIDAIKASGERLANKELTSLLIKHADKHPGFAAAEIQQAKPKTNPHYTPLFFKSVAVKTAPEQSHKIAHTEEKSYTTNSRG